MSEMPVVKVTLTQEQAKECNQSFKRLWDNYAIIGEVRKNNKIKFVIGAGIRDGVRYINIREFYIRKKDGVWKPGRDGITIPLMVPVDDATQILKPYEELMKVLKETVEALGVMELSDVNNAVYMPLKEKNSNAEN